MCKEIDKRNRVAGILLEKAFDLVDYSVLLSRMAEIGIGGVECDLFSSYLRNRKRLWL